MFDCLPPEKWIIEGEIDLPIGNGLLGQGETIIGYCDVFRGSHHFDYSPWPHWLVFDWDNSEDANDFPDWDIRECYEPLTAGEAVCGYVSHSQIDGKDVTEKKIYPICAWPRVPCLACGDWCSSTSFFLYDFRLFGNTCDRCNNALRELSIMKSSVTGARLRLKRGAPLPSWSRSNADIDRHYRSQEKLDLTRDTLGMQRMLDQLLAVHEQLTAMIQQGDKVSRSKREVMNDMARSVVRSIDAEIRLNLAQNNSSNGVKL